MVQFNEVVKVTADARGAITGRDFQPGSGGQNRRLRTPYLLCGSWAPMVKVHTWKQVLGNDAPKIARRGRRRNAK